ncbi:MAG: PIN domain nuclease [Gammaproteobacteria bacterium]|nr:PIN domain nuclease [Gammaproteobacteria bacterium]
MMLDSSVLIGHLRQSNTPEVRRLRKALETREPLILPDIVLMEVLSGARDLAAFLRLEQNLLRHRRFVPQDGRALARHAAWLYARCRWAGITPRSPNDCLVACSAIEAGEPLLHQDRDFERIASIEPALRLVN